MAWLLLVFGAGWIWWQSRPTSSPLVTDPVMVRTAQSMLRSWLTTSASMAAVPAYTGDLTAPGAELSSGQASDPVFMSALKTFQSWTNRAAIEFQESPHAFSHKLRTDGVLDKATFGVLAAFTQPPIKVVTAAAGSDFREMS